MPKCSEYSKPAGRALDKSHMCTCPLLQVVGSPFELQLLRRQHRQALPLLALQLCQVMRALLKGFPALGLANKLGAAPNAQLPGSRTKPAVANGTKIVNNRLPGLLRFLRTAHVQGQNAHPAWASICVISSEA